MSTQTPRPLGYAAPATISLVRECKERVMREAIVPYLRMQCEASERYLEEAWAFVRALDEGTFSANEFDTECDKSLLVSIYTTANHICAMATMLSIARGLRAEGVPRPPPRHGSRRKIAPSPPPHPDVPDIVI